jgi:formamidopyrimidine-DNA glycosylase
MPELPEVEAWRRGLERWLAGREIVGVDVVDPTVVRVSPSSREVWADGADWLRAWVGERFDAPSRLGKRLGLSAGERHAVVHLGMSGRFVRADQAPRHARVGWSVDEGAPLWFVDARRFGGVAPLPAAEGLGEGLGPDAASPLSGPALAARLRGGRAIKVALLDQAALAGLGNIHAAEALWRAGVNPDRPCHALDQPSWERLAQAIHAQIHQAIDDIPADVVDFVYVSEGGPNPFAVYQRAGEPCSRCGDAIEKTVQAGRSTYWCRKCQPD